MLKCNLDGTRRNAPGLTVGNVVAAIHPSATWETWLSPAMAAAHCRIGCGRLKMIAVFDPAAPRSRLARAFGYGSAIVSNISRRCVIAAALFILSNPVVGHAAGRPENLQSWSSKIDDAARRFEVLKRFDNEAVLDRETQLVWERQPQEPFSPAITFAIAVEDCYNRITGGRMGWRLPTVEELTSLLVETPTSSQTVRAALPDGHPFIGISSGGRPESAYWSITAGSGPIGQGRFTVAVNEPEVSTIALETNLAAFYHNWCVRGPGGGQSSREPSGTP